MYNLKNNKKMVMLIIVLVMSFLSLLSLYLLTSSNSIETGEMTDKINVKSDSFESIQQFKNEDNKINEFVLSKIPTPDVMYELTLRSNDTNPKTFPLELLYSGVTTKDIDMFLSAFTTEALETSWGEARTLKERTNTVLNHIETLSKQGKLVEMSYSFSLNEYKQEEMKGILYLQYEENQIIKVPFELEKYGEERVDESYRISTPIEEMLKEVISSK